MEDPESSIQQTSLLGPLHARVWGGSGDKVVAWLLLAHRWWGVARLLINFLPLFHPRGRKGTGLDPHKCTQRVHSHTHQGPAPGAGARRPRDAPPLLPPGPNASLSAPRAAQLPPHPEAPRKLEKSRHAQTESQTLDLSCNIYIVHIYTFINKLMKCDPPGNHKVYFEKTHSSRW